MSNISLEYFNKISPFFIRKGKRALIEKLFKQFLFVNATKSKNTLTSLFENCYYNSMYFIHLKVKTRRRKKRILYRITYLNEEEYEKRGLISFGKHINNKGKNAQPFISTLSQEIESLAFNKMHPVRILRDNVHKLAFKFAPKNWFIPVVKKNKIPLRKKKI